MKMKRAKNNLIKASETIMTAYLYRSTAVHVNLYKALLQNELTTYSFSEAAFNLMEAIEKKGEKKELSGKQLTEAYHYARSILAFVTENEKFLECKMSLAKSEFEFYDNQKAAISGNRLG